MRLFVSPGALFAELPVNNRLGGALLLLLVAHLLYAGLVLSTGVPDYEIAAQVEKDVSRTAEQLKGDEDSEERTRVVETLEKAAVFNKTFARVLLLVAAPLRFLLGVIVVASLLFLATALWGAGKADFRVLAGVAVFASLVELPRMLERLLLIVVIHASRVETSAAAFVSGPRAAPFAFLLLRRLDPYAVWYWALIGLGLWATGQLSGRRALVAAVALGLLAALTQGCLDLGTFAEYSPPPPET